jgi:LAGLIDADG DNA endonuclease family
MQLPCFNFLHSLFYVNSGLNTLGKPKYLEGKIVPINIYNLLTSAGLAFLIMGDGSRQNEGIHLSVYAYSEIECELLISVLTNKFNLKCSLHRHVKGPRIYIDKASTIIVRDLVKPYMVPSMLYKLGL